MVEKLLVTPRQTAMSPKEKELAVSSAVFEIENTWGVARFSELGGISSEIEQNEYMEVGPNGNPTLGRFLGKAKPPTVTLKRAMSNGPDSGWVWKWHAQARTLVIGAYLDTHLRLIAANQADPRVYTLYGAIPTKVELAGIKAGGTEVVIQTLTMQCDEIVEL